MKNQEFRQKKWPVLRTPNEGFWIVNLNFEGGIPALHISEFFAL
jgi:hypothetical protein